MHFITLSIQAFNMKLVPRTCVCSGFVFTECIRVFPEKLISLEIKKIIKFSKLIAPFNFAEFKIFDVGCLAG